MGYVLFIGLVAGMAVVGLVAVGFLGALAARDLTWLSVMLVLSALVGAASYLSLLRGWVERSHHPLVLRLLSSVLGMAVFFGLVAAVFDEHLAAVATPVASSTVPPGLFYWLLLIILLLGVVVVADRRHAELR